MSKLSVYVLPHMFDRVVISVDVGEETYVTLYFGNVRNSYVAIDLH